MNNKLMSAAFLSVALGVVGVWTNSASAQSKYDPTKIALDEIAKMKVGKADWPQWGGPQRNFQVTGVQLADQWPEQGPRRLPADADEHLIARHLHRLPIGPLGSQPLVVDIRDLGFQQ